MSLYNDLIKALPQLAEADFATTTGTISLQNDADEAGDYIAKWDYSEPIPQGFKLGK
jgi:hypothetical protein